MWAKGSLARALYSTEAETTEELSFKKGDILTVLEFDAGGQNGWWLCALRGQRGLCPGNYLEVIGDRESELNRVNKIGSWREHEKNLREIIGSRESDKDCLETYDVPKSHLSGRKVVPSSIISSTQHVNDFREGVLDPAEDLTRLNLGESKGHRADPRQECKSRKSNFLLNSSGDKNVSMTAVASSDFLGDYCSLKEPENTNEQTLYDVPRSFTICKEYNIKYGGDQLKDLPFKTDHAASCADLIESKYEKLDSPGPDKDFGLKKRAASLRKLHHRRLGYVESPREFWTCPGSQYDFSENPFDVYDQPRTYELLRSESSLAGQSGFTNSNYSQSISGAHSDHINCDSFYDTPRSSTNTLNILELPRSRNLIGKGFVSESILDSAPTIPERAAVLHSLEDLYDAPRDFSGNSKKREWESTSDFWKKEDLFEKGCPTYRQAFENAISLSCIQEGEVRHQFNASHSNRTSISDKDNFRCDLYDVPRGYDGKPADSLSCKPNRDELEFRNSCEKTGLRNVSITCIEDTYDLPRGSSEHLQSFDNIPNRYTGPSFRQVNSLNRPKFERTNSENSCTGRDSAVQSTCSNNSSDSGKKSTRLSFEELYDLPRSCSDLQHKVSSQEPIFRAAKQGSLGTISVKSESGYFGHSLDKRPDETESIMDVDNFTSEEIKVKYFPLNLQEAIRLSEKLRADTVNQIDQIYPIMNRIDVLRKRPKTKLAENIEDIRIIATRLSVHLKEFTHLCSRSMLSFPKVGEEILKEKFQRLLNPLMDADQSFRRDIDELDGYMWSVDRLSIPENLKNAKSREWDALDRIYLSLQNLRCYVDDMANFLGKNSAKLYHQPDQFLPVNSKPAEHEGMNSELSENDQQILDFFCAMFESHSPRFSESVKEMLAAIQSNDMRATKEKAKFVVLYTQRLVFCGDSLSRGLSDKRLKKAIKLNTDNLDSSLKSSVRSIEEGTKQFPLVGPMQAMVRSILELARITKALKDVISLPALTPE